MMERDEESRDGRWGWRRRGLCAAWCGHYGHDHMGKGESQGINNTTPAPTHELMESTLPMV